jgi:hypothetical protein
MFQADDVIAEVCNLHSGMGFLNPIDYVQFYTKQDQPCNVQVQHQQQERTTTSSPIPLDDKLMRAPTSGENTIRIYLKWANDETTTAEIKMVENRIKKVRERLPFMCKKLFLNEDVDTINDQQESACNSSLHHAFAHES